MKAKKALLEQKLVEPEAKLLLVVRAGVVQEVRGNIKGVKVEVFDMDDYVEGPSAQELDELLADATKGKEEIYY